MSDEIHNEPIPGADPEWEALARYVAGECEAPEAAAVEAWLAEDPSRQQLVYMLRTAEAHEEQHRARVAPLRVDTEAALRRVRAQMAELDAIPLTPPSARPVLVPQEPATTRRVGTGVRDARPASRRLPWRAVGMALAAGLVAMLVLQGRNPANLTDVREYRTAVGQTDTVLLGDGTQVVLAPGSTLTLDADYGDASRQLTLSGAAHFTVVHDDARPFVVRVGEVHVRDIGTAFTVKALGAQGATVAVTEGRVAVAPRGSASPEVELAAGDLGEVAADSVRVARGGVDATVLNWTRGELSYRDASLAEVRADLARWFGVTLVVEDRQLDSRTITARFRTDSLGPVLEVLSLALGADLVQRGDTVQLVPAGGTSPAGR
jgi:transmembrane sensor